MLSKTGRTGKKEYTTTGGRNGHCQRTGSISFTKHNCWQLYNRTQTINFKKEDIATWSTDDFHKKISELYLASVNNEKLLQQTRLEPFDPVIIEGNTRRLRPTLFDLLAHRALGYLKNDERTITKPVYAFEIDDETAFA